MASDWWIVIGILVGTWIVVDSLVGMETLETPMFVSVLKWLFKWLLCPIWGPFVLWFKYADHVYESNKYAADVRGWIKAELAYNADEQHLAYVQGLIDNDPLLLRAGTFGEYDPVLNDKIAA